MNQKTLFVITRCNIVSTLPRNKVSWDQSFIKVSKKTNFFLLFSIKNVFFYIYWSSHILTETAV
jgi:hypothetical protein